MVKKFLTFFKLQITLKSPWNNLWITLPGKTKARLGFRNYKTYKLRFSKSLNSFLTLWLWDNRFQIVWPWNYLELDVIEVNRLKKPQNTLLRSFDTSYIKCWPYYDWWWFGQYQSQFEFGYQYTDKMRWFLLN